MLRRFSLLALAAWNISAPAAEPPSAGRFDRVTIPPAKTSIYLGTVTMTMPDIVRRDGGYESGYQARVFPYFFSNEQGRLRIEVSDEQLHQLERGQPIHFKGRAVRADGAERRIEGTATPADPSGGRLKVRVFVARRIELIFNTTYRFEP